MLFAPDTPHVVGLMEELARVAAEVNTSVENIGARRLHTVMERVVEDISFSASEQPPGTTVSVTVALVKERVSALASKVDLTKYIL